MSETVTTALETTAERLARAGCETPRVDAELLLAHVLGTTRSGVHLAERRPLDVGQVRELDDLVVRRERREPLAYVLGEWGFRRLVLAVDARVLVPRPETEIVVERALALLGGLREPRVLDVGTGSGAIALAVADEHPGARVTAIDVSDEALAVASVNAERTGLDVGLSRWDLFEGLPAGPWDLVVSNPPYVDTGDVNALQAEVRDWEPRVALVGDGQTEAIVRSARDVLRDGGALVLETAAAGAATVAALLRELGYVDVRVTRDLTGRDRVVEGIRP